MVEVTCNVYFFKPLPCFTVVVEVEVDPIDFSCRRCGRCGGEVW